MAITYTWTIPEKGVMAQTVNGKENVVTNVNFILSATDGTNTVDFQSVTKITFDPNADFLAFNKLKQDIVIEWVKSTLGNKVLTFQQMLNKLLELKSNPPAKPAVAELPWA